MSQAMARSMVPNPDPVGFKKVMSPSLTYQASMITFSAGHATDDKDTEHTVSLLSMPVLAVE